jgi:Skp family chaperone for outer membrane proteins
MRLVGVISATALAVVSVGLATDAAAQRNRNNAASVVAINMERVLSDSAIGRDYSARLSQIAQQISTEVQSLAPEAQSVQQEAQRLAQVTRNMSQEQIRNNSQVQAFNTRRQQLAARERGLQGDFECTRLITGEALLNQINPIVQAAARQRGAGVVINSSGAIYVAPEVDITATVIQQLDQNQATRTATVARHAVSECQARAQTPGQ